MYLLPLTSSPLNLLTDSHYQAYVCGLSPNGKVKAFRKVKKSITADIRGPSRCVHACDISPPLNPHRTAHQNQFGSANIKRHGTLVHLRRTCRTEATGTVEFTALSLPLQTPVQTAATSPETLICFAGPSPPFTIYPYRCLAFFLCLLSVQWN